MQNLNAEILKSDMFKIKKTVLDKVKKNTNL